MLRAIGGETARAVLVPILTACITTVAAAADERGLLTEPGHPLDDGRWFVPVALLGPDGAAAPTAQALTVRDADGALLDCEVVPLAPAPGGRPTAQAVLLDDPLPGDPAALRGTLDAFLARGTDRARRRVLATSAAPGYRWSDGTGPEEALRAPADARLWDSVLAAMKLLARRDDARRRVLFLVSDGAEARPSEHVLATCVEAAQRARIAVHVLVTGARATRDAETGAGEARLRVLAAQSGGLVRAAGDDPVAALAALLAVGDAAGGLVVTPPAGATLPAQVRVAAAGSPDAGRLASVAPVRPLESAGRGRWLGSLAGLAAVAAAGWWLWRRRRRTVGVLLVRTRRGRRRFPVPRAGASLGSDPDNTLVLPSGRVARHHAVIRVRDGALHITDLRSPGGTRVNGEPVRTRPLADGDTILLGGSVELVYRKQEGDGAAGPGPREGRDP